MRGSLQVGTESAELLNSNQYNDVRKYKYSEAFLIETNVLGLAIPKLVI